MAHKKPIHEKWRHIISDQSASGLSVTDYCKKHKLSASGLYKWRSLLKTRSPLPAQPEDEPVFVPLDSNTSPIRMGRSLCVELSLGRWLHLSWKR